MKVYFVNQEELIAIAKETNVEVVISNRKGLWISFSLKPIKDFYRKINHSFGKDRKSTGVCWHGHADFMKKLFTLYPKAKLVTILATYNNAHDFYQKYEGTYDQEMFTNSVQTSWITCTCNND